MVSGKSREWHNPRKDSPCTWMKSGMLSSYLLQNYQDKKGNGVRILSGIFRDTTGLCLRCLVYGFGRVTHGEVSLEKGR